MRSAARATSFVAAIVLLSAAIARGQTAAGSIIGLSGDATIERASATITAAIGLGVMVGERIQTGLGGRIDITLTVRSVLQLSPSSSIGAVGIAQARPRLRRHRHLHRLRAISEPIVSANLMTTY